MSCVRRPTAGNIVSSSQPLNGSIQLQLVASPPAPSTGLETGNGSPSPPSQAAAGRANTAATQAEQLTFAAAASTARQISKLKRFLTTLHQFSCEISPDVGERVHALVTGLAVSTSTSTSTSTFYFLPRTRDTCE